MVSSGLCRQGHHTSSTPAVELAGEGGGCISAQLSSMASGQAAHPVSIPCTSHLGTSLGCAAGWDEGGNHFLSAKPRKPPPMEPPAPEPRAHLRSCRRGGCASGRRSLRWHEVLGAAYSAETQQLFPIFSFPGTVQ